MEPFTWIQAGARTPGAGLLPPHHRQRLPALGLGTDLVPLLRAGLRGRGASPGSPSLPAPTSCMGDPQGSRAETEGSLKDVRNGGNKVREAALSQATAPSALWRL